MSDEPKSFWGKLALLTAFLSALGGVGALLSKCAEERPPAQPTAQVAPNFPAAQPVVPAAPTYPVQPATQNAYPAAAHFCCDMLGYRRCPLLMPAAIGSGCFCPGQGAGVSCP